MRDLFALASPPASAAFFSRSCRAAPFPSRTSLQAPAAGPSSYGPGELPTRQGLTSDLWVTKIVFTMSLVVRWLAREALTSKFPPGGDRASRLNPLSAGTRGPPT